MSIVLNDCYIGNFPETQGFGARPEYYKQFGLAGHEGVDFGTPVGTPVISSTDGVVVRDIDDAVAGKNYGINVIVWDKTQLCATYYCHLSSNVVSVGQSIVKGQLIGYSGATGNVTGPHLHFNLCKTDVNGNRPNTDNGYLGFINPDDGRIAVWNITNPTKPTTPPAITQPANNDDDVAIAELKTAYQSLPESDNLHNNGLKNYVEVITTQHKNFDDNERKAQKLDGMIATLSDELKVSGDVISIQKAVADLIPIEDRFNKLRAVAESVVGNEYTDDQSLFNALGSLKTEHETLSKSLEVCSAKLELKDILQSFDFLGYTINVYKKKEKA